MIDRPTLKARAKIAFKRNYWKCVVVAIIAALVMGTFSSSRSSHPNNSSSQSSYSSYEARRQIGLAVNGGAIGLLLTVFVAHPLEVGCDRFFVRNTAAEAPVDDVLYGFKARYGRNVLTLFLRDLYIALWSLLFVIPGIVKAFSYMLVPYLLAESPEMNRTEAFELSKKLMNGHKLDAFVLELSFLGWYILGALTGGILLVFYVLPYVDATRAEFYNAIRWGSPAAQSYTYY